MYIVKSAIKFQQFCLLPSYPDYLDCSGKLANTETINEKTEEYRMNDVAGERLFQVQWPDKTFVTVRQSELIDLGFEVAMVSKGIAKVTFESELIYALPKPVALYVADSPNVVQPEINLIN